MHRTEKDFIGRVKLPEDSLYGIHAYRAKENFPFSISFNKHWYKAMGTVKLACYQAYANMVEAMRTKEIPVEKMHFSSISAEVLDKLQQAAIELSIGKHYQAFIVPAVQGGAGTSINMNVNEIIANRALQLLGKKTGMYELVHPINDANIFQSTNDVVPTALKVAILGLLPELEEQINTLRTSIEEKERTYRHVLRTGYTQMQEAVPSSYGMLFGSYNEALSRDWWRVSKCFERIKTVNIGGSAIGTGITIPKYFIMQIIEQLQKNTGLPIARGEHLPDSTSNWDTLVEIHAILKSHAVNLEKIAADIRLLSSDLFNEKVMNIPDCQVGSSIMPGKVNPVISEYIISIAHQIYANDTLVHSLASQGCLDLNAYIPQIGHAVLQSLELLIAANTAMQSKLISGITINETDKPKIFNKPAVTTALIPYIGYKKATEYAIYMKKNNCSVQDANTNFKYIEIEILTKILAPENLLKLGYSVVDVYNC